MLVAKFNEMVLFRQELRRRPPTASDDPSNYEDEGPDVAGGAQGGFDEVLVRYGPPSKPAPDFSGAREEGEIAIPLRPDLEGLKEVSISLHGSGTMGYDMGTRYNEWFTRCFGYEVMLVYLGPGLRRVLGNLPPGTAANARPSEKQSSKSWFGIIASSVPVLGSWLGSKEGKENGIVNAKGHGAAKITFADCSPYLIVTKESLADVSSRLPGSGEMDITKFRPNIVLSGSGEAWEEDFWGSLEFLSTNSQTSLKRDEGTEEGFSEIAEPARLLLTANCARCMSINIDYDTGRQGQGEAGRMLKKLMADRRVDSGNKWSPVFGRYGFLDGRGMNREKAWAVVRVGDEVVIGERNEERTVWSKCQSFSLFFSYSLPIMLLFSVILHLLSSVTPAPPVLRLIWDHRSGAADPIGLWLQMSMKCVAGEYSVAFTMCQHKRITEKQKSPFQPAGQGLDNRPQPQKSTLYFLFPLAQLAQIV